MKNDCTNSNCIFREDDNDDSCKKNPNYCKGLSVGIKTYENFRRLDENVTKLEIVSGYSLEELLERFAAGWTLEPPKKSCALSELLREFE